MARRPERRARVRVEPGAIANARISLPADAVSHLRTVLRLGLGDVIEIFDGEGEGATAEIVRATSREVEVAPRERVGDARESPLDLTLAVALSRGAKLDWIVEKATELGVSSIRPFSAERSVPRGDRLERWCRIAGAAAAQSGRLRTPRILPVASFDEVIAGSHDFDVRLLLWERSAEPLPRGAAARRVLVATGPEGGFVAEEASRAIDAGFLPVGLGPRVLRAETAAIVAVTVAQLLWGDLGAG